MMMRRLFIEEDKRDEAIDLIDDAGIENDLDNGNRIMIKDEDLGQVNNILVLNDIDYSLII